MKTLREVTLESIDIYVQHDVAASLDARYDAGEFSGPAHSKMARKEVEELAKANGFTLDEVDNDLMAYEQESRPEEDIMVDSSDQLPEIVVERDFDGYFEKLVRKWVARKEGPFHYKRIKITAGPWRSSAVSYYQWGEDGIHFDFYSALRKGFGGLTEQDQKEIIELL